MSVSQLLKPYKVARGCTAVFLAMRACAEEELGHHEEALQTAGQAYQVVSLRL
jgi:hypothetical protein